MEDDNIGPAIPIHVRDIEKAYVAQIPVRVHLPIARHSIARRLQPALLRENIVAAIAIHITDTNAVAVAQGLTICLAKPP
jgi:hypothetical protein